MDTRVYKSEGASTSVKRVNERVSWMCIGAKSGCARMQTHEPACRVQGAGTGDGVKASRHYVCVNE